MDLDNAYGVPGGGLNGGVGGDGRDVDYNI